MRWVHLMLRRLVCKDLLKTMWKILQNFVDTFNTLTTGLDIRATSQHLHTSISPDKITVFTGAVAIASKTNTSAGQNVMTINDIKWIMTDHVRYWQTNTDIEMLKHGMGGGQDDRIQGIYATCDRGNPRWDWHSGGWKYWHRCTSSIVFPIFVESRFVSVRVQVWAFNKEKARVEGNFANPVDSSKRY